MNVKCEEWSYQKPGAVYLLIYLETRRLHFFLCLVLLVARLLSYLLLVSLCPGVFFPPWGPKLQDCALEIV